MVACLTGCAATSAGDRQLLGFLDQQPVTRAEVYGHLGPSYSTYEEARIVAYRIGENGSGYYVVAPSEKNNSWKSVKYDLMLLFDDTGTLRQHSLIAIHAPHETP
jgi:hypothetical protein